MEKINLWQDESYIDHEVRLRVQKETTESNFANMQKNIDDKFSSMQKNTDERFAHTHKLLETKFNHLDYKINFVIGVLAIAAIAPFIKAAMGV